MRIRVAGFLCLPNWLRCAVLTMLVAFSWASDADFADLLGYWKVDGEKTWEVAKGSDKYAAMTPALLDVARKGFIKRCTARSLEISANQLTLVHSPSSIEVIASLVTSVDGSKLSFTGKNKTGKGRHGECQLDKEILTFTNLETEEKLVLVKAEKPGQQKVVTEKQFLKVMQDSCVRCHRNCDNIDAMVTRNKWIIPGNPNSSPLYTCLGIAKRKNLESGLYHDVSKEAAEIISIFIKNLKATKK